VQGFLLVCILFFSSLEAQTVSMTKPLMGGFVTITLDKKDSELFEPAVSQLKQLERALSSYDINSPIFRLNQEKKAILSYDTYLALKLSSHYYRETDGFFNIAIGHLSKDLYRFGNKERTPSTYELKNVSTDLNSLVYNEISAHISNGIKIDLGGMGKGFTIDRVSRFFKDKGVIVTLDTGHDIRCLGLCRVELQVTNEKRFILNTIQKDIGISTTTLESYSLNPKTKKLQNNFLSVTLISKISSADLDAFTTAVSVMPMEKAYAFLKRKNLAYIIVQSNNKIILSDNLDEFVVLDLLGEI